VRALEDALGSLPRSGNLVEAVIYVLGRAASDASEHRSALSLAMSARLDDPTAELIHYVISHTSVCIRFTRGCTSKLALSQCALLHHHKPIQPTVWYSANGASHTHPPSTRIAQTARATTPGRVGRVRTRDLSVTSTAPSPSRGANPH
jgi:hypothetical protein